MDDEFLEERIGGWFGVVLGKSFGEDFAAVAEPEKIPIIAVWRVDDCVFGSGLRGLQSCCGVRD